MRVELWDVKYIDDNRGHRDIIYTYTVMTAIELFQGNDKPRLTISMGKQFIGKQLAK